MTQTLSRRRFVKLTAAATALFTAGGKAQLGYAPSLTYPAVKVANVAQVKTGQPIIFNYPDASAPAILVKLGKPAIGGVGSGRDIVAFSALCTHMGCPVQYEGEGSSAGAITPCSTPPRPGRPTRAWPAPGFPRFLCA